MISMSIISMYKIPNNKKHSHQYQHFRGFLVLLSFISFCHIARAADQPGKKPDCGVDEMSEQVVDELIERGFTEQAIEESCQDLEWAEKGSDRLETASILHSLNFSERERKNILRRDISLGSHLVKRYRKDKRLRILGIVLTIIGIPIIVGGALLLSEFNDYDDNGSGTVENAAGGFASGLISLYSAAIIVVGAASLLSGMMITSVGFKNKARYLAPEELWENRDADAIEKWYKKNYTPSMMKSEESTTPSNSSVHVSVIPTINPNTTGLTLQLTF